ncbi:hypothetical protein BUE76_21335 [Cnuella takakiae]|nr:hypothetical protein BUE76_21335 [Cnuella takakiae]
MPGKYNVYAPPKALVAPLDWGLGHATRCIPIIRHLLAKGWEVWLAGEQPVQSLLQAEFPNLPWLPLDGYRVSYGATGWGTALSLARQVPRLVRSIRAEQQWLQHQMSIHRFHLVVSDNRYGLYHPAAYCIFLGHQLQLQTPLGLGKHLMRRLQYRFINRFDACWVPDFPGAVSLAGSLSHPEQLPAIPVRHTGPLSRLEQPAAAPAQPYVLLLVSGPEPQRSLLEALFLQQAATIPRSFVLVRGLPGRCRIPAVAANIEVYNHLPAAALQDKMAAASLVVCRSGYSTIMDLAAMDKKSILIPTPAQTEQQYLARHLQQQGFAMWCSQAGFNLNKALKDASLFAFRAWPQTPASLLQQALDLDCTLALAGKVIFEKEFSIESAHP